MKRVLVTGGTGVLGREVVERLQKAGYTVRIMSRKAGTQGDNLEWAQVDIMTGQGLEQAVAGVDIIVNCMSSAAQDTHAVDVEGTRRLLEKARAANVAHFLHISIVGIDRIPLPYYKEKLAAEEVVKSGGVPWTILRATQFHNFIDYLLTSSPHFLSIILLPTDFKFQPIDVGEVADQVIGHLETPAGMLPDVGGPYVLTSGEMAQLWMAVHGIRHTLIPIPVPGKTAAAYRQGLGTCPDQAVGKITWAEWLHHTYGTQPSHTEHISPVTP